MKEIPQFKIRTEHNQSKQSPNPGLGYGDYLRFRDLILEQSGLHFPEKKKLDLETGLLKALAGAPMLTANKAYDLDDYYNLLRHKNTPDSRAEMRRLINTLTVGETHFFRDTPQFNALATHVLPTLISHKRNAAKAIGPGIRPQLRIWSAGCASGEEPYSLAILLKELLPDIEDWQILILATDINEDSLNRAREAAYSEWSFRETRAKAIRAGYFTRETGRNRYRLRDDIRQMVTFAPLNLIEDDYPSAHNNTGSMDLILCRNVTIYFTERTTRQVVAQFYKALVERGWLAVGHSEPSLVIYRAFQAQTFPDTLLYQKTGRSQPWPTDWDWLDKSGNLEQTQVKPATPPAQIGHIPPNGSTNTSTPAISALAGSSQAVTPPPASPLQSQNTAWLQKPHPSDSPLVSPKVDFYQLAKTWLDQGQTKQAITQLQNLITENPKFAAAHSLLGRAYANLGQWDQARHWCWSALELDSLLSEAYYVLALVYQNEDQIQLAINMLKKAIYLERKEPLAHFNLAMLYKKTGQPKPARRACQNLIRILEKWPPKKIIPDSGGATAKYLLEFSRRILSELESERKL